MGWCEWLEDWVSDEEMRKERRKNRVVEKMHDRYALRRREA